VGQEGADGYYSFIVLAGSVDVSLLVAGGGGAVRAGGALVGGDRRGSSGAGFSVTAPALTSTARFRTAWKPRVPAPRIPRTAWLVPAAATVPPASRKRRSSVARAASGAAGGGYTGADLGDGGTLYVAPDATDPVLITGFQLGNGAASLAYLACFVASTLIAIPDGYGAVETLEGGDLVLSARRQRAVAVRWIGSWHLTCARVGVPGPRPSRRVRARPAGPRPVPVARPCRLR